MPAGLTGLIQDIELRLDIINRALDADSHLAAKPETGAAVRLDLSHEIDFTGR